MMTIVDVTASSLFQFLICNDTAARKKIPQMNDSRDKNKSQRMGRISSKIALFCQPNIYLFMKQGLFRKLLPHLIAIVVFLVIALIYCKPALEGQVVQQSDITGWKGSVHQSQVYGETHDGKYPLWTNSVFGGMPAFQIAYSANNFIPGIIHNVMTLWLPAPIQYFFLACICFYMLCIILRVNPWVGIMGALGFAYATYNPVIIEVGHVTKMLSITYMPALLGSLILIYERKYWLGAALTAMFTSVMVAMNHPQIAYYFFIAVAIMTIYYVISWIKAKDWKHFAKAVAFTACAAIIGLMTNAVTVMSTYEYQKETIRGGGSVLTDTTSNEKPGTGLDRDYAFAYSINIAEPLVMLVPRMYGGSGDKEEVSQDKSKAVEAIRTMPQELQQQMPLLYYWGGIKDISGFTFTSGPPYAGAIICFLAILALFVADRKHKWWAATAIVFTILMAWGAYLKGFNDILFDYFPLYNKFRAPSMALVIPQLLLPLLAVLGLNTFVTSANPKELWPKFKKGLIATGALFVLLFLLYMSFSYLSSTDDNMLKQVRANAQPQVYDAIKSFFDGLKEDRKGLFMGDIWRSLGFIAVAALMIFLLVKNKIKPLLATLVITAFVFIDLILVDVLYLNKENYQDPIDNDAVFNRSPVDEAILADTSFYRVSNLNGGDENLTSYHYNAIGGYHPAKLRLYQDMLVKKLRFEESEVIQTLQTRPDSLPYINTPALNMLNTKYFIYKERNVTKAQWRNVNALGNCWFVNNIQYVKDANAEMAALGSTDLKTTAVVQESYKPSIPFAPQPDSAASIRLIKNDNDIITYSSSSSANQFAVFSEIYYQAGWKAFIDGKEAPIVKTNYLLRGLAIQPGQHTIVFKFEPQGYYKGQKLTNIFSIAIIALFVLSIFMEWRNNRKTVGAGS
jgi:hypothetical protein